MYRIDTLGVDDAADSRLLALLFRRLFLLPPPRRLALSVLVLGQLLAPILLQQLALLAWDVSDAEQSSHARRDR